MSLTKRLSLLTGLLALLIGGLFWHFTTPTGEPLANRSDAAANARTSTAPTLGPITATPPPAARLALDYAGVTLPSRTVTITSETHGRVMQVLAQTGQPVAKGQTFAVADPHLKRLAVTTAQAQLDQVRSQLAQAGRQVARLRALAAERNASVVDMETAQSQLAQLEAQQTQAQAQLEQAQRQLADATVCMPASGILTERTVEPGAVLQPGTELGKVVDVSTLKVRIMVPEGEVFRLHVGQIARLQPDALPGLTLTARIATIGVVADEVRAFPVELTLPNAHGRLKAGQSIKVSF